MGCFLGCFGVPKDRSRSKPIRRIPSRDHRFPDNYKLLQQNSLARPPPPPPRSSPLRLQLLTGEEERPGAHLEPRDTNDAWVAAPEQLPEEKRPTPIPESGGGSEKQSSSTPRKRVTFDLNVKTYEREPEDDVSGDVSEEQEQSDEEKSQRVGSSTPRSSEAFPSNHRYQNYTISDGENSEEDGEDEFSDDYDEEDDDCEDCGLDDDDAVDAIRGINEEDESFESYFSPPIEKKIQSYKESIPEQPIASDHGARDRSRYVHSVLNPVENLSQWKEAKAKTQPLNSRLSKKENICLGTKNEVLAEASLSNWLPSSELSPVKVFKGNNSCRTESKHSISGVLHVEDVLVGILSTPILKSSLKEFEQMKNPSFLKLVT
ncbi:hypothetical protein Taro_034451 [Colocasia esculenta]|uniref:Uncharacterized protein n=1 Tax=Colocasia esculenta TaxID=4460 RepID=A0A843VXT8_COLES|nr:hypothetical protein [Colocasia esculenta]